MPITERRGRPAGCGRIAQVTGRVRRSLPRPTLVPRSVGTAWRLAGLYAVVLAAVLAGTVAAFLSSTKAGIDDVARRQLQAEEASFVQAAATRPSGPAGTLRTFAGTYLSQHAVPDGDLVEIAVPGKWGVANAGGSSVAAEPAIAELIASNPTRTTVVTRTVEGHRLEVMAAPILVAGSPSGLFVATVDTTLLAPAGRAAARLVIGESAIALIAGVASTYLILRRLLRRIGRIADTADRLGRAQDGAALPDRLGDQGTQDEVAELASSFDSMLDRIDAAVRAQHQLLSDVSHQLRTPLTVARGHLELLGRAGRADPEVRETIGVAVAEMDRMARLIDRLLELGRAREPVRHDVRPVDLRDLMADLFRSGHALADRNWELGSIPDLVARLDGTEVHGAMLNLIDNAVRATGPGDTIRLSASAPDDRILLRVEDSGPGIPEADRVLLLGRFARRDRSSGGSGLGLAIVDAVCRAHGGRVRIGASELGGACVTMEVRGLPQQETGPGRRPALTP